MAKFFTLEMGRRLKEYRERARLSQAGIARRMGLTYKGGQSRVAKLELGRIPDPRISTIALYLRACGAKGYELRDVLDRLEPPKASPVDREPPTGTDQHRLRWGHDPNRVPPKRVRLWFQHSDIPKARGGDRTPEDAQRALPAKIAVPNQDPVDELRQLLTPKRKLRKRSQYWQMVMTVFAALEAKFYSGEPWVPVISRSPLKTLARTIIGFYRHLPEPEADAKLAELRKSWTDKGVSPELLDLVAGIALREYRRWTLEHGAVSASPSTPRSLPASRETLISESEILSLGFPPKAAPLPVAVALTPEELRDRLRKLEHAVQGLLIAEVTPLSDKYPKPERWYILPSAHDMVLEFYRMWKKAIRQGADNAEVRAAFDIVEQRLRARRAQTGLLSDVRKKAERLLKLR
jgi:transcriptional regulator with XRE-family HTH domain